MDTENGQNFNGTVRKKKRKLNKNLNAGVGAHQKSLTRTENFTSNKEKPRTIKEDEYESNYQTDNHFNKKKKHESIEDFVHDMFLKKSRAGDCSVKNIKNKGKTKIEEGNFIDQEQTGIYEDAKIDLAPKKSKKVKLGEMEAPEKIKQIKKEHRKTDIVSANDDGSIQKKKKESKCEDSEFCKETLPTKNEINMKHSSGDGQIDVYKDNNTDEMKETNKSGKENESDNVNNFDKKINKKKKKREHKNMSEQDAENLSFSTIDENINSDQTTEKKEKKKKHKEKAAQEVQSSPTIKRKKNKHKGENYDLVEAYDVSEVMKKKKKHKHENYEGAYDLQIKKNNENEDHSSVEGAHDAPRIKRKKKKHKVENKEDSYMSSDYSLLNMNETSVDSSITKKSIKKTKNSDKSDDIYKKYKGISSELNGTENTNERLNQPNVHRGSLPDVAKSETVSSPDTFTIEVFEDNGSTLNGSFSSCNSTKEEKHKKKKTRDEKQRDVKRNTKNKNEAIKNMFYEEDSSDNLESTKSQNKLTTSKLSSSEEMDEDEDDISGIQLLEQVDNKSQLDENLINKLGRIFIMLPWSVPPLHLIETRVAGRPTVEQRKEILSLGVDVKMGIFSKVEDDKIKSNFKEFCKIHDLSEDPTLFLNFAHLNRVTMPTLERIKFVRFLAHDLDNRLLFSVYKRFQRLYRVLKIKSGRFTAEEDRIIKKYMEITKSQTPFSDLGRILNRDKLAVEKRFEKLKEESLDIKDYIKWTKKSIENLLKILLDITRSHNIEELRDREIISEEWRELSSRLNIRVEKLRRAWFCTIYPRLFIPESVETNEIKIRLIEKLMKDNETDWRNVNWDQIAKNFEGFTGAKLNKMLKETVIYYLPLEQRANLGECLKSLMEILSVQTSSAKLKKIQFSNKDLTKSPEPH